MEVECQAELGDEHSVDEQEGGRCRLKNKERETRTGI